MVVAKAATTHEQAPLCCTWSKDGTKVFSAGADKNVRILDMNTGQSMNFVAVKSLLIVA